MSRKLMAILVSSAMAFGSVSTSSWSAADIANSRQAQAVQTVAKNQSPLPPGGAARIKQAQGETSPWVGIGLLAAVAVIALIILNDDDEGTSTATN